MLYIGMSNQSDKGKIIRQIYYDSDSGFGSIKSTYDDAHKILNSITYNDVKDFFRKAEIKTNKRIQRFQFIRSR